jgi:hypothetical protein
VGEDLVNDVALGGLNEADDLHPAATSGADERIDFPHLLEEGGPAAAGKVGRGLVVISLDGGGVRAVGFGAAATGTRGIEAEIADEVPAGLGNVLGELGDEVQGLEDLEIPGDAAEEVGPGGVGEALGGVLLGEVKDLALLGDTDHPLETEWAPKHVVGQTLAAGAVVGRDPHREVHLETRMRPREHLRDERLIDLAVLQQQVEDLPLPELFEGLVVELGKRNERAVGGNGRVGDQGVDVRMPTAPPTIP